MFRPEVNELPAHAGKVRGVLADEHLEGILNAVEQEGPTIDHRGIGGIAPPYAPHRESAPGIVLQGLVIDPADLGQQTDRRDNLGLTLRPGRRGILAAFSNKRYRYGHEHTSQKIRKKPSTKSMMKKMGSDTKERKLSTGAGRLEGRRSR